MVERKRRLQRSAALVFAICVAALIAGAAEAAPLRLLLGTLAGFAIGIALHELGHLAFAAIASIPVHRIFIGTGPLLWQSHFGDTALELRALPLAGGIQPYPVANCRWYRFALLLIGGVLGNLICLLLGLFGLSMLGASGSAAEILVPILFVQLLQIIVNVVPLSGKGRVNDGMRLLRLLTGRASASAQLFELGKAYMIGYGAGNTPPAMTAASARLLYHAIRLDGGHIYPDARDGVLRELHHADLSREEKILALDSLVTDGIVSGDPAAYADLDAWSQQALALGPDLPTLQGSRGSVLVELGRCEEGKALLAPLAAPDKPPSIDSFMSRAFLALAEHRLGNVAAARQLADAAHATAAKFVMKSAHLTAMLARIDSEIPPAK
jgi:hypothetical protein